MSLEELKCCFNKEHIVIEPVLLNCGGNACRECIKEDTNCLRCNKKHHKDELIDLPVNDRVESFVKSNLKELFKDLELELKDAAEALAGCYVIF